MEMFLLHNWDRKLNTLKSIKSQTRVLTLWTGQMTFKLPEKIINNKTIISFQEIDPTFSC